MSGNFLSSIPAMANIPPQRRASRIETSDELSIGPSADTYIVQGSGTVTRLPAWPQGTVVLLHFKGSPTFVNSARLVLPGGNNVGFRPGDAVLCVSAGDGSWNCYPQGRGTNVINVFDFIPLSEHAAIQSRTSTYDVSSDVQLAINTYGGKAPIYVPYGKYVFKSPIKFITTTGTPFANGLQIIGDGAGAVEFDNQVGATNHTDTFTPGTGSVIITVTRTNHGKSAGQQFEIYGAGSTVGGLAIDGVWYVSSVVDANTFTFNHTSTAVSNTPASIAYAEVNPLIDLDTNADLTFQQFVRIHGIKISNSTSPTASTALRLRRTYQVTLDDVWVTGMTHDGIQLTDPNPSAGDNDGGNIITLKHVRVENCSGWGIDCVVRSGNNELSYLTLESCLIQGNGTASAASPPPSGGIRCRGQVITIRQVGTVINQNCGLFIEGASGLSNTVSVEGFTTENNIKKGIFITGVQQATFKDIQIYNNDSYVASSGFEIDGTNFAVSNVRVCGAVVRATAGNNPFTAFKLSGANADARSCVVDDSSVAWANFGYTGQTKYSGVHVKQAGFAANKGSTDQSGIVSATWTKITFSTVDYDHGSFYDSTNSKWTPPPGKVKIQAAVYCSVGAVDQAQSVLAIYKNGALFKNVSIQNASGASGFVLNGTCTDITNGTDYYEVYFNGGGAGNKTISGSSAYTFVQAEMV